MSPPGRPKGEYRRAQPEGTPVTAEAADRCPRCGGAFHCGIGEAQPCACTGLKLDAALQLRLRGLYSGCLCLRCLQALATGAPP
jgi:hypothetical protein